MPSYFPQPSDPDAPSSLRSALPTWRQVAAVWAGGSLGCGLRALLELAGPASGGFPLATLLINFAGAFLLGLLLESLLLCGDDSGVRRRLRLTLGTGVLGGFTTYSTFAIESVDLLRSGRLGAAASYVVITVAIGIAAAWAGIACARRMRDRS